MPTVKQMQYFCAVMASGTAQGAAQAVYISQPALTRSISNLESELGLKLFERSKSGMLPTAFAERVAPRFEEILLELDDIRREADLYRNLDSGQLRIGFGQAVRELLSRHCLPRFVALYPGVSLSVREGESADLARSLQHREVDMIIAGHASYAEYEFVHAEHILNVPVQVMVKKGHPLTKRKSVAVKDILDYPHAIPTSLGANHPFNEKVRLATGQSLAPQYLCSDYSALESIVARTEAWTVNLVTELHRAPPKSLCALEVSGFDITIELSVMELARRSRSPAADRFIQALKSILLGD